MNFLSPLFLAGSVAAAVPILLHLLKREPEARVKFAAVQLLKRAPVEDTARHRLRELLLLALRVATLVLLALAFARPFFPSGHAAGPSGVTVVALDTSYSMAAPGRFERARQLAKDAIARAAATDAVGVVTFADSAEIADKPSADRVLAVSALDRATPGFGGTRYRAALSTAAQAIAAAGASTRATIVVVTDLQESGWDDGDRVSVPEGVRLEIADVGELPANLAVTGLRSTGDRGDRIIATVRNTSTTARDVRAHLALDSRPAGDATTTVGANQSADVTFPNPARANAPASASVSIDDPDGLPADNVRYLALNGADRPQVLAITSSGDLEKDAFYVDHALTAAGPGGDRGFDVHAMSAAQLSSAGDDRLSRDAAIIVMSTRGLEPRGREKLAAYARSGGGVLVAAGPDVDGAVAADLLGAGAALKIGSVADMRQTVRALAPADLRHPIFRPFAGASAPLALVRVRQSVRIDGEGCRTLARLTAGDAALIDCAAGEGRGVVFASDLNNQWNDFPLHASFVPFLHEAVRYLASGRAHSSDYVVGEAPAGVPQTPGVYPMPATIGKTAARVSVNVDPRESSATRLTVDEFQSAVTRLKDSGSTAARVEARQQEDNQHVWQYALALMLVTLVVEGVVASRTA